MRFDLPVGTLRHFLDCQIYLPSGGAVWHESPWNTHVVLQVGHAVADVAAMSDLVSKQLKVPLGSAVVITNGRLVWDHNPATGAEPVAGSKAPALHGMAVGACIKQHNTSNSASL